jgi:hypothetical protein
VGASTPHNPMGLHGLLQGLLYFTGLMDEESPVSSFFPLSFLSDFLSVPWSIVLEKLMVAQLLKKFSTLCSNRSVITVLTGDRECNIWLINDFRLFEFVVMREMNYNYVQPNVRDNCKSQN